MTSTPNREALIADLDAAVQETLAWFAGPGEHSAARIDRWGARDVLAHLPYWHDATAWGIASAAHGGPPWLISGTADEVNDAALRTRAGESAAEITAQLRQATARLLRVAREAPDLDTVVFRFTDGRTLSAGQRLEMIARHWRGHLQQLQEAGR
ncbi:MAG TPA: DinB family protein [Dehalococcoidia bacterium]|nr:DinB family protein [Dehalococcoidia bacterium]